MSVTMERDAKQLAAWAVKEARARLDAGVAMPELREFMGAKVAEAVERLIGSSGTRPTEQEARQLAASWKNVWPHTSCYHAVLCVSDDGELYAVVRSGRELGEMFAKMIVALISAGDFDFLLPLLNNYAAAVEELNGMPRERGTGFQVGRTPLPTNQVWTLNQPWPEPVDGIAQTIVANEQAQR